MKREIRDDIPDHPCKAHVLDDDCIRPDGIEIGHVSGCTCEFVVVYKGVYRDMDGNPVHVRKIDSIGDPGQGEILRILPRAVLLPGEIDRIRSGIHR